MYFLNFVKKIPCVQLKIEERLCEYVLPKCTIKVRFNIVSFLQHRVCLYAPSACELSAV